MNEELMRTHLYDWHKEHGDVIPFAGWEMPVRYTDIRQEHMAVRDAVGIFDVTHMYRFFISGKQSEEFLQTITTNNVSKLKINDGQYTTCLNEHGGTRDDLMLYRVGEFEYIWVTNAVNGPKIFDHMQKYAADFDVSVENKSREVIMVAIQGPKAVDLLSKMAGQDISAFPRFSNNRIMLAGYDCYLCRTGYTGEDGAEVLVPDTPFDESGKRKATEFWMEVLKQGEEFGIKPCGLGARDSLRLEAGFCLYGHELEEDISPIEAKIPFAVKFKVDPHYVGYDIVRKHKKQGVTKTRIGLSMIDRGVPRQHYPVLLDGKQIGEVASGSMSPVLKKGIAMAFVKPDLVNTGDTVEIDIKGRIRKAKVTKWPFYDTTEYGLNRTK